MHQQQYVWSATQQQAFDSLKSALTGSPIPRAPDFVRPFELHTDEAKTGLGEVLGHRDDDKHEYVVTYASQSKNKTKGNYLSYEGEAQCGCVGM